jgi:hypothetical protein
LETGELTVAGEVILTPEYRAKCSELFDKRNQRRELSRQVLDDLYPLGNHITRSSKASLETVLTNLHGNERTAEIRALISLETGELTDAGRATMTQNDAVDCKRLIGRLNQYMANSDLVPPATPVSLTGKGSVRTITKEQAKKLSSLIARSERSHRHDAYGAAKEF